MIIEGNQTVRDIAIQNPATVRVFEQLGIDYCCGGRHPLREACERASIPLDQAIAAIRAVETDAACDDQADWMARPLSAVIREIVDRHHAFVRSESARLGALSAKVAGRHGAAHPELLEIQELFTALTGELSAHMTKEEQILFPFIESLEASRAIPPSCFGSVDFPIARMLAEHDDAGALTARIRNLSSDFQPPESACPSYRGLYQGLSDFERDLHHHIHLENNILFPRAIELEKQLSHCTPATCA